MAYAPGFHHDVFVSYARRSDLADWVTKFKDELESHLKSTLGGREPEVWMDSRLEPGADFREKIQERLSRTAIFIAVVSPHYVQSPHCMEMELRFFQDNNKSGALIQVVKTPLEPDQQMPLPKLNRKEFFELQDWGPDEFEPGETRFSRRVKQMAVQVRTQLIAMRRTRQKIYLTHLSLTAENSALRRHRDELLNEFEDRGYSILPRQVLLDYAGDDFTRRNVEESDVLVYIANGAPEEAQFNLAVELRKPTVACALRPLPMLSQANELPVMLGSPDWKLEVVRRVESKLSARTLGKSA